jgi:hypothetical protein
VGQDFGSDGRMLLWGRVPIPCPSGLRNAEDRFREAVPGLWQGGRASTD